MLSAMTTIAVNGLDVYAEVHGPEGAPWVLNIGGSGGDLRVTLPERSPLNERFRVIHYDQRGLGRTSAPDGDWTMADYADDAAALVCELAGGRAHVVGTSFGGMVALELAARHPDVVDRLALLCTSPGGEHASYPLHTLGELEPDEAHRTRMRNTDTRWDPDADEPIPGLGALYDLIDRQNRSASNEPPADGLRRQLLARAGHDVVDRLGGIDHEVLLCAGRFDGTAPLANSELMAERLPHARLEVFDAGHLLMFQDRGVMRTVVDFLSRPDPS